MLEQLTFPIDYEDFAVEKSEVSVGLTVTDPGHWVPTNPNDRIKKMVEVHYLYFFDCELTVVI